MWGNKEECLTCRPRVECGENTEECLTCRPRVQFVENTEDCLTCVDQGLNRRKIQKIA